MSNSFVLEQCYGTSQNFNYYYYYIYNYIYIYMYIYLGHLTLILVARLQIQHMLHTAKHMFIKCHNNPLIG